MRNIAPKIFLILMTSVFVSGCHKTTTNPSIIYNEKNRALIDQKHFDEAIDSLSDHLLTSPQDMDSRVLLASALAGRSGINLRDFTGFARLIIASGAESAKLNDDFDPIEKLKWEINLVFKVIDSIPSPTQGPDDVLTAIDVLNVQGLSHGRYLYRAILKLVVFKYNFNHKYHMQVFETCRVKPRALDNWYKNVEADFQDILGDVQLSQFDPNQKSKIEVMKKQIADINKGIRESLGEHLDDNSVKLPTIIKPVYPECG